jgi:AcrR family transcriptional regulator
MSVQDQPSTENARARILEETWQLLERSPDLTVRIADIAAAAGVSRQAVYLHFGNRSNLLLAAVRYRDATAGLTKAFIQAARHDPLPGALAGFVEAWFDYIPRIQPVANLLSAAAQIEPDARAAWEDRMSSLRNLVLVLTRRLSAERHLRSDWTAESAADWIWHRTHVDGWRHLVGECGWAPSDVVRRLAASLERDLLA